MTAIDRDSLRDAARLRTLLEGLLKLSNRQAKEAAALNTFSDLAGSPAKLKQVGLWPEAWTGLEVSFAYPCAACHGHGARKIFYPRDQDSYVSECDACEGKGFETKAAYPTSFKFFQAIARNARDVSQATELIVSGASAADKVERLTLRPVPPDPRKYHPSGAGFYRLAGAGARRVDAAARAIREELELADELDGPSPASSLAGHLCDIAACLHEQPDLERYWLSYFKALELGVCLEDRYYGEAVIAVPV